MSGRSDNIELRQTENDPLLPFEPSPPERLVCRKRTFQTVTLFIKNETIKYNNTESITPNLEAVIDMQYVTVDASKKWAEPSWGTSNNVQAL